MPQDTGTGPRPYESKAQAVRDAMAAKGNKAKPGVLSAYLKETFGLEMTNDLISSYRSMIRKREREGVKKPSRKSASEAPRPAPAVDNKNMSIDEVRILIGLVKRLGKARVTDMIELLTN